jgi:integrase/recombinase XerD
MAKMVALVSSSSSPQPYTLSEAVEDFLARDWSQHTLINFTSDLRRFSHAFDQRPIDQITSVEIQDYLDGLTNRQGEPVAAETYNRHYGTLGNLFGWLVRQEELEYSPMSKVDRKRMSARLPRPMTAGQIQAFFNRIDSKRDQALFSLLLRSGLRVSEALSLDIEDLNMAEKIFQVIGKGNCERVGYLSEETVERIRRYLRERRRPRSGALFVSRQGRLSYAMVHRLFKKYAQGLEESGRALTIHQLRHTFGSERAGKMDALVLRDLMGHKSLKTTLQYAQVNPEKAREAFKEFDRQQSR